MKNAAHNLYEAWMKESDPEASEMLYSVYLHTLREPIEDDIDFDDNFDPLPIELDEDEEEEEDDDFDDLPIGIKTS